MMPRCRGPHELSSPFRCAAMGAATLADSLQAMHVTQSAHFDDHSDGMGSHAFRETVSTYLAALLALGTALLVSHVLGPWGGAVLPFVTVFGAVAAAACVGGYRPAALVSVLGYVLSAWLLVPDQAVPDRRDRTAWLAGTRRVPADVHARRRPRRDGAERTHRRSRRIRRVARGPAQRRGSRGDGGRTRERDVDESRCRIDHRLA